LVYDLVEGCQMGIQVVHQSWAALRAPARTAAMNFTGYGGELESGITIQEVFVVKKLALPWQVL